MASTSTTPIEDLIRERLNASLSPTYFTISNDSHLHAHHRAMVDSTSKETHFRLNIVSAAFAGKPQPARHRMIYNLLDDELKREGGIHALQLTTRTPEEETKRNERVSGTPAES